MSHVFVHIISESHVMNVVECIEVHNFRCICLTAVYYWRKLLPSTESFSFKRIQFRDHHKDFFSTSTCHMRSHCTRRLRHVGGGQVPLLGLGWGLVMWHHSYCRSLHDGDETVYISLKMILLYTTFPYCMLFITLCV